MAGGTGSTPPPTTGGGTPVQRGGGGSTGLKVGGWILVVLGTVALIIGVALVVIHLTQRDSGFYTSDSKRVSSSGYAITSEALHFGDLPSFVSDIVGTVRVGATSSNGRPLFVGIARQSDVDNYLGCVARSQVTDFSGNSVDYDQHSGGPPAGPPGAQRFWEASSTGSRPGDDHLEGVGRRLVHRGDERHRRPPRQRGCAAGREDHRSALDRDRLPRRGAALRRRRHRDARRGPPPSGARELTTQVTRSTRGSPRRGRAATGRPGRGRRRSLGRSTT